MKRVFRSRLRIEHDEGRGLYLAATPVRYGPTALYELNAYNKVIQCGLKCEFPTQKEPNARMTPAEALRQLPQIASDPHGYERQVLADLQIGLMALAGSLTL